MICNELDLNTGSDIIGYLASLSDNIVKVSDNEVSIYNKFHLTLSWSGTTLTYTIAANDTTISSDGWNYNYVSNPAIHLLVCISDDITLVRIFRNGYNDRFISLLFIRTEDDDFGGGLASAAYDFYNIKCSCFNVPGSTISPIKAITFNAPAGAIAVIDGAPFGSNNMYYAWVPSLLSCSTVPVNSTVTIDGKNYLAIGTNTLIKMN